MDCRYLRTKIVGGRRVGFCMLKESSDLAAVEISYEHLQKGLDDDSNTNTFCPFYQNSSSLSEWRKCRGYVAS